MVGVTIVNYSRWDAKGPEYKIATGKRLHAQPTTTARKHGERNVPKAGRKIPGDSL